MENKLSSGVHNSQKKDSTIEELKAVSELLFIYNIILDISCVVGYLFGSFYDISIVSQQYTLRLFALSSEVHVYVLLKKQINSTDNTRDNKNAIGYLFDKAHNK